MRKALFLDRDGVINVERDYVYRREDFVWQDGIFTLAATAAAAGLPIVVVTNQSGIARGLYSEEQFQALTAWMCGVFAQNGSPLARVYHCPYHPAFPEQRYERFRHWRKPEPGMLLQARDDLSLDLTASLMIGDRWSDAEAAFTAGLPHVAMIGDPGTPQPAATSRAARLACIGEAAAWLETTLRR